MTSAYARPMGLSRQVGEPKRLSIRAWGPTRSRSPDSCTGIDLKTRRTSKTGHDWVTVPWTGSVPTHRAATTTPIRTPMNSTSKHTPKALRIYLELREYPILCDEIRKRMREEIFRRGTVQVDVFEEEVRRKAKASQRREHPHDPSYRDLDETWELRVSRTRERLTDFYFAHNVPHSAFRSIVADVLGARNKQDVLLSFNPELAPWDMLFSQAAEFETADAPLQRQTRHHLQEIIAVLTKGMLSDQLTFVGLARRFFKVEDLRAIAERRIGTGKIGGKAAGMRLAWRITQSHDADDPIDLGPRIVMPESWHIAADLYYEFVEENDFYGFLNQKYKDLDVIRAEYPAYRERYDNAALPRHVVQRLSDILDQAGDGPLIVRSSSLLEDNFGTSFAGKYETHFCASQGGRRARLEELCNAVRLVYASVLNPDALAYRKQMHLIDYDERMAVLIQKVAGTEHHGKFYPQIAGVGFSHNPYRWTPQIDRSGGFLRIVWGLGTRAVDRVAGDHPRMVALSHPTLRPERTPAEIQRYSQHAIDCIDLEKKRVCTYPVRDMIRFDTPGLRYIASVMEGGDLRPIHLMDPRIPKENYVITLDGLLRNARFVSIMRTLLRKLEKAYECPVDTEFTIELVPGEELDFRIHLLQCRPQAKGRPAKEGETFLPRDVPNDNIVFASSRTVCSGRVENIRYVVFVDPERYARIESASERKRIAQTVGRLNERLKGNAFIFVGPGRWGSSNPELGVPVSYADIFNADALVEVPMAIQDEEPEASYGTHFFQDLIEAEIFPVAVYPGKDDDRIDFAFFRNAPNALAFLCPDLADMAPLVMVIDVPSYRGGQVLELAMDSEGKEAMVAYLKAPSR
jgi:hypothetical protein